MGVVYSIVHRCARGLDDDDDDDVTQRRDAARENIERESPGDLIVRMGVTVSLKDCSIATSCSDH